MMNAVWSRNAVLYEMNLRQTTSEGTLAAAAERLGFLRDLGIDAVWLMPHYPIGKVGRKGKALCRLRTVIRRKFEMTPRWNAQHPNGKQVLRLR